MKNKLLFLLLGLFLFSLASVSATVLVEYNATVNSQVTLSSINWRGQSFTYNASTGSITAIEMIFNNLTTSGLNITFILRNATAAGVPIGLTNLSYGSVMSQTFDTSTIFRRVNMTAVTLVNGNNYTLIAYTNSSTDTTGFWINQTNTYAGEGNVTVSLDSGLTWANATAAAPFRIADDAVPIVSSISTILLAPPNGTVLSVASTTFAASVIPSNLNLTNATLIIYNSTGIYKTNFTTLSGNITTTANLTISSMANGHYLWNYLVWGKNSTGSNFSAYAAENYSFEVGSSIITEDYAANVYETSRQTFSININLLPGIELSLAQLVYNGTNYTVSNITSYNETGRILTRSIDIPVNPTALTETLRNFFWRFTFSNSQQSVQETPSHTQNVTYINFQICNPTYNIQALNFTFFDEINQTNVNTAAGTNVSTNFESSWQFWVGGGETYRNYSFQNLSSTDINYQFCIYPYIPTNFSFKADGDIDYSATGFRENQYHLQNATLSNVSSDILLYLLNEGDAQKFFLTFKQGVNDITGATVTVQKFFTGLGQFITVGILLTDDNGQTTMWQQVDKTYRYSIVKDGVLLGTVERVSICSVAPCALTISLDEASSSPLAAYYDGFAQNVFSNLTFNQTTNIVTYEFIDITGLANYFRLLVTKVQFNQTGTVICDTQSFSPAGTITCNLTGQSGEFVAKGFISRSPEVLDKLLNIITDDDAISSLGITGIFLIMALIITLVFAGAVIGRGSPSTVLWIMGLGILCLKLAGLFPFTWTVVVTIEVLILFMISKVKN